MKAGAKEQRLRALREKRNGPRVGTVSRSTILETGTLLAGPNLDREEQKRTEKTMTTKTTKTQTKRGKAQSAKTAKPLDGAVKRAATKAKRTKVPGVDRSPLTVGTFIARAGGASMAEMEAQFKMEAHPLRAKIHAARHQLGFAIEYDAEKGRYFGKEPRHKAAAGKAA